MPNQGPRPAGWAVALVRWRWAAFGLSLALAVALTALGVPRLWFDVGHRALFVEGDPTLEQFEALEETFGSDEVVYALVETDDALASPHRERLVALGDALEALPFVEEVRSPLRSPVVYADGDTLYGRAMTEVDLGAPGALETWRARVLGYRPFRDVLISADARWAGFLIRIERDPTHRTPAGRARINDALRASFATGPWKDYPHAVVGTPLATTEVARILGREVGRALGGGLLVALLALLVLFRSARAAAAPFAVVAVTLAVTFGGIGLTGSPLSQLSVILVTLAISVGVADAMHLVAGHQRHALRGVPPTEALALALTEVWRPCLFTSLTTAAGFLSLLTSQVAPVRALGAASAVACLVALGALLGVAPALVAGWRPAAAAGATGAPRVLAWLGGLPPAPVAVGAAALCLAAAPGLPRLAPNQNLLRDLAPGEPLRQDFEFVHQRMGGAIAAEVVVEPLIVPEGGAPSASLLRELEAFQAWLEGAHPAVRTVRGIPDALAECHRVWGGEAAVPQTDAAAAQLLFLLQNADPDLCERTLTLDGSALRVTARLDLIDSRDYAALLAQVDAELARRFAGVARTHLTGGARLLGRSNEYLLATQARSFALALAVVSALIAAWTRELRLGLLSLAPNLAPALVILGAMGWSGVEVTTATALIATIAIGIIVDDTIHVTHALRVELAAGRDLEAAIDAALARAGRAVLFTTVVLVGGFAVYALSDLASLRQFGLLTGATFVAALIADVAVLPALLRLWPR